MSCTEIIQPSITKDPRFRAGRKFISSGNPQASIDLFAILVEESRHQFGATSIEAASAYYEYGNALLRARQRDEDHLDHEQRLESDIHKDCKEYTKEGKLDVNETSKEYAKRGIFEHSSSEEDGDDVQLSLEMMENSLGILDDYIETSTSDADDKVKSNKVCTENKTDEHVAGCSTTDHSYILWAKDQLPRILIGIGDIFAFSDKNTDAVDAYIRASPLREQALEDEKNRLLTLNITRSIDLLKLRRQVTEIYVLIAEQLLQCPAESDLITSKSKVVFVRKEERVDFAGGYYDKARNELQKAVLLMGEIASTQIIVEEKENICNIATMLMGVGQTLATCQEEERNASNLHNDSSVTVKKRRTK